MPLSQVPRPKTRKRTKKQGKDLVTVETDTGRVVKHTGDLVPEIREWWNEYSLSEAIKHVSAGEAVQALLIGSNQHLIKRLVDPKTPQEVKDRIALAMAPRFTAEFRGKLGAPAGKGSAVSDLLQGYRIG